MSRNINIEAEGSELILKNKAGDHVIIPKKYRKEVQGMINDRCHDCIDNLVSNLPIMSDYAEDGSLFPKINIDNTTKTEKSFYDWGTVVPQEPLDKMKSIPDPRVVKVAQNVSTKIKEIEKKKDINELDKEIEDKKYYSYYDTPKKTAELQKELKNEGYYIGPTGVDAKLGNYTKTALDLKHGVIDVSKYKSKDHIKELQKHLKKSGYDLGNYGPNKDGVDGMIGEKTLNAINDYTASSDKNTPFRFKKAPSRLENSQGLLCDENQCATYVAKEIYNNSVFKSTKGIDEFIKEAGIGKDAWLMSDEILKNKGELVFDRKNKIVNRPRVGDVVSLYTGGNSAYQQVANKEGDGNTHVGVVSKVYSDGSYDINHNVHKLDMKSGWKEYQGREYTDRVNPTGMVEGWGFLVNKITRPNYGDGEYVKPIKNDKIKLETELEYPAAKKIINEVNQHKNKIQDEFNLNSDEFASLTQAVFGIIDQESKFGKTFDVESRLGLEDRLNEEKLIRQVYELGVEGLKRTQALIDSNKKDLQYGVNTEASKGLGRVKREMNLSNNDLKTIQVLSNESEVDEYKDFIEVYTLLAKNYQRFIRNGLDKNDALYRAIRQHNPSGNTKIGEHVYTNKIIANNKVKIKADEKEVSTTFEKLLMNPDIANSIPNIKSLL